MRITKLLSEVCAAAFLAGSFAVQAQDNPDQAAARAALAKKLSELNAQTSPQTSQTMTPTTPGGTGDNAAQAAARAALMNKLSGMNAQAVPPSNAMTAPATPGGGGDNASQAAARAALNKELGEQNAQQAQQANPGLAPMVMKPSVVTPERPAQPAPAVAKPTSPAINSAASTPVPPTVKNAKPAPAPAAKPMPSPAKVEENYAGKTLGFAPMQPPPPPVSAEKQAELNALLARYMANEISPDEYQKERAAIMAKP